MRSRRSNRGENSNGDGFSFSKFLNSITPHFKRKNKDDEISPKRKKRKIFNNGENGEVPLHQKIFQLIKQERQKHRAEITAVDLDPLTNRPKLVPITETDPALYEMMGDAEYTRKKYRIKVFRTILQIATIVCLVLVVYMALFYTTVYQPAEERDGITTGAEDTGFIALSYFGVDRVGNTSDLIGIEKLNEHLGALKKQGYVTITQEDIENYYIDGKPLPKKSLFLMFEDGRRDTAIFAQSALEKYNYKATVLTYPEKFDNKDPKFLLPDELMDLEKSTFWEMGTNGYRLQYINVFDRYDNYIGEIDPLRYAEIRSCLGRKYNHYLMDYIRDKNYMPKESYEHMKRRISYDYERLRDIYTDELGTVPGLYSLMHANTGQFGNNPNVSKVNEKWIRELFTMNFNREGYCFNQRNSSMYDLTRMQPQPYWPINHLLMRIKYDINQDITFEQGNSDKYDTFELMQGAAEMKDETYTLTTIPHSYALAKLKDSQNFKDVRVKVQLQGNAFGTQKILLRSNDERTQYISVGIANGCFIVEEKVNGNNREIYKEKLSVIDGEPVLSVDEDRQRVEIEEYNAFARYADSPAMAQEYLARAEQRKQDNEPTVENGAQPYNDPVSFHSRAFRNLDISINKDKLSVSIDDKKVVDEVEISNNQPGYLFLVSSWNNEAWSQRNLADDVYDGVFKKLEVYNIFQEQDNIMYTMSPEGWELAKLRLKEIGLSIIDFAVNYF